MKKLFIVAVVTGALMILLRFSGPEDSWICVDNIWTKHGNPSEPAPTTGCGPASQTEIDFDISGHLVKDNPGMKPGVWFLVYEKPGSPALSAELLFDAESKCALNGREGLCPDVLLPSSAPTNVRGVKQSDGLVRVVSAVSGNPE